MQSQRPNSKDRKADSKVSDGYSESLGKLAEWTGLEPATPGVTGRGFAETLREMRAATEPFVHEAASILCTATPRYLRHEDGTMEVADDGLTEPMREELRKLDVMRDQVRAPYIAKLNRGLREE